MLSISIQLQFSKNEKMLDVTVKYIQKHLMSKPIDLFLKMYFLRNAQMNCIFCMQMFLFNLQF